MSEFQILISTFIGIGGLIVAFWSVTELKKSRKEKRFWITRDIQKKEEETRNKLMLVEFKEEIINDIKSILSNYTTVEKNDRDNEEIKKELLEIKKEITLHNDHFAEYQKQVIEKEITRFAEDLRKGIVKSRNSFKTLGKCYQKYKDLGGNGYIEEEWSFIKEAMKYEID